MILELFLDRVQSQERAFLALAFISEALEVVVYNVL